MSSLSSVGSCPWDNGSNTRRAVALYNTLVKYTLDGIRPPSIFWYLFWVSGLAFVIPLLLCHMPMLILPRLDSSLHTQLAWIS